MNLDDQKENTAAKSQNPDQAVDASRRAFSKKGLVAPVIMTLANRSAWGGTNMCTQSGFTSFQNQNGAVSHPAHAGVPEWKTPSEWASVSVWPASSDPGIPTLGQATYNTTDDNFSSISLWPGEVKTLAEVKSFESASGVIVLRQTFNGNNNNNTVTLLDELSTGAPKLIDFKIATVLNHAVSPVPSYYLSSTTTLEDYQLFYQNCVN